MLSEPSRITLYPVIEYVACSLTRLRDNGAYPLSNLRHLHFTSSEDEKELPPPFNDQELKQELLRLVEARNLTSLTIPTLPHSPSTSSEVAIEAKLEARVGTLRVSLY